MSESISPELAAYLGRLRRLTPLALPDAASPASDAIRSFARSLQSLPDVSADALTSWVAKNPHGVPTLALTVGLGQEKLIGHLRERFRTGGWYRLAQKRGAELIEWMDEVFDLVALLDAQRNRVYSFDDVLVARGGTRATAVSATKAGRLIEDAVQAIVEDVGLPHEMRGRFVGTNNNTGPADLAIPSFQTCVIAVACKGFDSTGSKLTAAWNEINEMITVHRPNQYLMAVVDGVGWLGRIGDMRRIFAKAQSGEIDGLYTLNDLQQFRSDLVDAAVRAKLL